MTSRSERLTRLGLSGSAQLDKSIAEEAAVAVEFNGIGYAVMMMTPADLEAFALGFALTERIAATPADLVDVDIAGVPAGVILRITVSPDAATRIGERIRHRTSDTGCGLCGVASLESLARPVPAPPPAPTVSTAAIFAALGHLDAHQPLNRATGAVHAAAWCDASGSIRHIAEDVGRHNALDKLIGMIGGTAPADSFMLVTSRLSFEMVDKALVARAPMLVGISAATTMAVDHARAHGLTMIALARPDAMLAMADPHGVFDHDGSGGGT
jgi:FdhD protein